MGVNISNTITPNKIMFSVHLHNIVNISCSFIKIFIRDTCNRYKKYLSRIKGIMALVSKYKGKSFIETFIKVLVASKIKVHINLVNSRAPV